MNALFTALYTRWNTNMSPHILYNTEAIGEVVWPYGTVALVSDVPDWTQLENFEDCLIQFNLFSETPDCSEVGLMFEALKAAFDKHDLAIVGCETMSLERLQANLIRVENKWQYIVTYFVKIQIL